MAKIQRISSLEELYGASGHLFPDELLKPADKGLNNRERTFSGRVTFRAFAAQILSRALPVPSSSAGSMRAGNTGEALG